uniref:Uncharacterized protein n=1 Tax=Zea mays TaxID=4577 RepID=A0A804P2B7_MAIZE
MGGILLALIKGAGLMLNRVLVLANPPLPANDPNLTATICGNPFPGLPQAPPEATTSSGAGGLFGDCLAGRRRRRNQVQAGARFEGKRVSFNFNMQFFNLLYATEPIHFVS